MFRIKIAVVAPERRFRLRFTSTRQVAAPAKAGKIAATGGEIVK
jgi:hypothetical protein